MYYDSATGKTTAGPPGLLPGQQPPGYVQDALGAQGLEVGPDGKARKKMAYSTSVGGAARAHDGGLLPGGTAVVTGDAPGRRTGVEEMVYSRTPITVVPMGNRPLPPEIPRAASGGTYGMPDTPSYTTYSPEQLGNQPFIKKLRGDMPTSQFGGFGAKLSNPSLGIDDMPSNINLQRYMSLLPSERDQTSSLYGQGLAVDFRDLLEQARRASPFGVSFGPAGYGG